MLRKILSLILIFMIPLMPLSISDAQEIMEFTLAVLNLDAKAGISQTEAESLSDYMCGQVTRVVNSKKFKKTVNLRYSVVERSEMKRILEEQGIQLTGCTDVSCAVKLGNILNAHRVIIGSVGLFEETYTISARIVDVETGKILTPADYMYTGRKRDYLLKKGVPYIVHELMYGRKPKSYKKLYIAAAAAIAAGIAVYLIISPPEDEGTIL